jgi:hypothetical protein
MGSNKVSIVGKEVEQLKVSSRIEPVLERVLTGRATPEVAVNLLDISEYELGVLLRALIRQRSKEQRWEFTD